MLTDISFAKQITGRYKKFGSCSLCAPLLVFAKENRTVTTVHTINRNFLLKLSVTLSGEGGIGRSAAVKMNLTGQEKAMKEFQTFRCISTIFENRERQPDAARKAERKLIRILSEDFYDRSPIIQRAILNERIFFRRERAAAGEELEKTKFLIEGMEQRLTVQEKILKELRQAEITEPKLPKGWMDGVTKEVMKKLGRELHLEKLRRGLT